MPTPCASRFNERDVENFYDREDGHYRSFWDPDGSLHWGYFDDLSQCGAKDFATASKRWNAIMLEKSKVNASSKVLDLGCGNGNTAIWLTEATQCSAVGIDISGVRVASAQAKAASQINSRASFKKASATALPFCDEMFTHVWSQATFYHVEQREKALSEIARVLQNDGIFVFDTVTTPKPDVSQDGLDCLYHRIHADPGLNLEEHIELLSSNGFSVEEATDLSDHFLSNYLALTALTRHRMPELSSIYERVCASIQANEVGWAFFLCRKR